jgi:hypothetical protein
MLPRGEGFSEIDDVVAVCVDPRCPRLETGVLLDRQDWRVSTRSRGTVGFGCRERKSDRGGELSHARRSAKRLLVRRKGSRDLR